MTASTRRKVKSDVMSNKSYSGSGNIDNDFVKNGVATGSGTTDIHGKLFHESAAGLIKAKHVQEIQLTTFSLKNILNLLFCAAGILICYFYFGVAQENITKGTYGEDGDKFVYTQALVFVQCSINAFFAYMMVQISRQGQDDTPQRLYAFCAFSYLMAMIASNHALQYVPYPTQVLGKSCKPIPIMIFGVIFARKRYPLIKYLFVFMIVAGVAVFLYKEGQSKPGDQHFSFSFGEFLLLLSLSMDGTTGAIQERIRASYRFRSHNMMLRINLWSTLYLLIGLLGSGELVAFLGFVESYPFVLINMLGLSIASALGQYFIFKTVTDFGPLPCSIVTTTRKLFTILASVILFQNPMTQKQWFGTVLVFLGLTLDGLYGKTKKSFDKSSSV